MATIRSSLCLALSVAAVLLPLGANGAIDTVKVDFAQDKGPILYRGSGFLHTLASSSGNNEPIKPRLLRGSDSRISNAYSTCVALGCSMQVVMSDNYGYGGTRPGDNGWPAYETWVRDLVNKYRSANRRVQWDIWNEPDSPVFWRWDQPRFLETWDHAYRTIKSIDPTYTVVGPSNCCGVAYTKTFLAHCKESNTLPDIVTFHVFDPYTGVCKGTCLGSMVNELRTFMDSAGIGIERVQVNEMIGAPPEMTNPGISMTYLAECERVQVEGAAHACWDDESQNNCWNNTLNGLLNTQAQRRSVWWMYKSYADITGNVLSVARGSAGSDGVMGINKTTREIRGAFGRNNEGAPVGDVVVVLQNLASTGVLADRGTMTIEVARIANTEDLPSNGPVVLYTGDVQFYTGDQLPITVPGIGPCDGFTILARYTQLSADNTPPTMAPAGLTAQALGDSKVRLTWQPLPASADAQSAIMGYAVYKNGASIDETRFTADTVEWLSELASYTFEVAGINEANLEGPRASVQITTPPNTIPPRISFCYALDSMRIAVYFSEPVEASSATSAINYVIGPASGGNLGVTAASLDPNGKKVILSTNLPAAGASLRLIVSGVKDLARTPNLCRDTASFTYPQATGVWFRYFERSYDCALPQPQELLTAPAQKEGTLANVAVAAAAINRTDEFLLYFSTYLLVTTPGDYKFYLASDDGSAFYLGGEKIIDCGGCHTRLERSSPPMYLQEGVYPLAIVYGEDTGPSTCVVQYVGPAVTVKQPLPQSSLLLLSSVDWEKPVRAKPHSPVVTKAGLIASVRYREIRGGVQLTVSDASVTGDSYVAVAIYDVRGSLRTTATLGGHTSSLVLTDLTPGPYVLVTRDRHGSATQRRFAVR